MHCLKVSYAGGSTLQVRLGFRLRELLLRGRGARLRELRARLRLRARGVRRGLKTHGEQIYYAF